MLTMIITNAVVSKGRGDAPALVFAEDKEYVRFRIGASSFDKRAPENTRWDNFVVKGFGPICERIKKMKLDGGAHVNLVAKYDVDTWEDKDTGEKKSMPVLIVSDIEYCYSGKSKEEAKSGERSGASEEQSPAPRPTPENFTGFEAVGSNMFFPGG